MFIRIDSAALFVKAALEKFESVKDNPDALEMIPHGLEDNLMKEKKMIQAANNKFLTKKRKRVTPETKVFPYLLDENLERKKTQPKWLKSVDFYERDVYVSSA